MRLTPFELGPSIPAEEVGYARVSDKDNQDADFQIALLKKRGIPDDNIFVDEASGRTMTRPQLDLALKLMYARPGWTLVVYKLDRLGRDLFGLMKLMKRFEENGWNLVSLTESIDTRTPMGKAFFAMMGIFAQLESDLISERTKAGVARRREKGLTVGREPKFTLSQMRQIQADLEGTELRRVLDVAKKWKCSPGFLQKHWPGWRSKNREQRRRYLALNPLIGRPD